MHDLDVQRNGMKYVIVLKVLHVNPSSVLWFRKAYIYLKRKASGCVKTFCSQPIPPLPQTEILGI